MEVSSQQIIDLLTSQLSVWDLVRANYEALQKVEVKKISFDDFAISVQFNPARIQSSAAKVDAKTIQERKCFLCPVNLPEVQKGIDYKNKYQILVNPFPIFPQHFTIPSYDHVDQLIFDRYEDMLDLAKSLDKFTIFYNGPKCGASAPDHAHFQAGNKGFLPIEQDMDILNKTIVKNEDGLLVYTIPNYLRNGLFIESTDKDKAVNFFKYLYALLHIPQGEKEPMMNIVTWYDSQKWYSSITPRAKHRPTCFYGEGDANILISPASVDMGGVLITPLEKDFRKITKQDIVNIFEEVCIDNTRLKEIINQIKTV